MARHPFIGAGQENPCNRDQTMPTDVVSTDNVESEIDDALKYAYRTSSQRETPDPPPLTPVPVRDIAGRCSALPPEDPKVYRRSTRPCNKASMFGSR